jgi:adenylate cyclase
VAVDREELRRRGVWDPEAPNAEDRLALIELLWDRGASYDQLERNRTDLNGLSADLSIRGPGRRLTLGEAADLAGVEREQAVVLLRALGFPEPPADDPVFTEDEARMFAFFAALDVFGPEVALQLVRVLGSSLARIADAIVSALRLYFEVPMRAEGVIDAEISSAYKELADTLLPQASRAQDLIVRRYLVNAAYQQWELDPLRATTTARLVVGFADLVGFTALARAVSTSELIGAIDAFERGVEDLVLDHGGRVVKHIGDEVMFVIDEPAAACRLALAIADRFSVGAGVPPVRVALATGQVLTRDGDYYGRVVNAASRLVELAEPSGVVVSENVQQAVGDEFRCEPLPPTRVKGYDEPVSAFRLQSGP